MDNRDDNTKTPEAKNDEQSLLLKLTALHARIAIQRNQLNEQIKSLLLARISLINTLIESLIQFKQKIKVNKQQHPTKDEIGVKDKQNLHILMWFIDKIQIMLEQINKDKDKFPEISKKAEKFLGMHAKLKKHFESKLKAANKKNIEAATPDDLKIINPLLNSMFEQYTDFISSEVRWGFLEKYVMRSVNDATNLKDNFNKVIHSHQHWIKFIADYHESTTTAGSQQSIQHLTSVVEKYEASIKNTVEIINTLESLLRKMPVDGPDFTNEAIALFQKYLTFIAMQSIQNGHTPAILQFKNPKNLNESELSIALKELKAIPDTTKLKKIEVNGKTIFPEQTISERVEAIEQNRKATLAKAEEMAKADAAAKAETAEAAEEEAEEAQIIAERTEKEEKKAKDDEKTAKDEAKAAAGPNKEAKKAEAEIATHTAKDASKTAATAKETARAARVRADKAKVEAEDASKTLKLIAKNPNYHDKEHITKLIDNALEMKHVINVIKLAEPKKFDQIKLDEYIDLFEQLKKSPNAQILELIKLLADYKEANERIAMITLTVALIRVGSFTKASAQESYRNQPQLLSTYDSVRDFLTTGISHARAELEQLTAPRQSRSNAVYDAPSAAGNANAGSAPATPLDTPNSSATASTSASAPATPISSSSSGSSSPSDSPPRRSPNSSTWFIAGKLSTDDTKPEDILKKENGEQQHATDNKKDNDEPNKLAEDVNQKPDKRDEQDDEDVTPPPSTSLHS